jgi:ATP-dependent DNA ligase
MPRLDFIAPMEAKLVSDLPAEAGWQYEPKWDGFRCIAIRDAEQAALFAKSGKDLGRYFPEVLDLVRNLPGKRFMLDGELLVTIDGKASFDDLQQRLHPAESRIQKLSKETPALLVAFDMLVDGKTDLIEFLLEERRRHLEHFFKKVPTDLGIRLSPKSDDPAEARRWFDHLSLELDGIVCKRLDQPYLSGERAMLKLKRIRTADCVIGGFRYGTNSEEVGSLLLGLFNDEGKLDHVGFTSAIAARDKPALTRKLEKLKGGAGFTGNAPGGPSRWSTERSAEWVPLEPELVVEVSYDQITGERFRHGTKLLRWRPDKAPRQCRFEQLATPVAPEVVIRDVLKQKNKAP